MVLTSPITSTTTLPSHAGGGTDWTMVGALLTALFTGGIVVLTWLGYKLVRREAGASEAQRVDEVAFSLALESLAGFYAHKDRRHFNFKPIIIFRNTHREPLRYVIDTLSLNVEGEQTEIDQDTYLSTSGVVAPGQSERFQTGFIPLKRSQVPTNGELEVSLRYGRATRGYEWRDTFRLKIVVPAPNPSPLPNPPSSPVFVGTEMGLNWNRIGDPKIERLNVNKKG